MPKRNGTETAPDGEISFEESQQWQLNVLSQKEEECRLLQELDKIHGGPSRTDLNGNSALLSLSPFRRLVFSAQKCRLLTLQCFKLFTQVNRLFLLDFTYCPHLNVFESV